MTKAATMPAIDRALRDNLAEIQEILQECGAEATWLIEAATHTTITFTLDGHHMMMPIRDGGTLLVSFFPATPPPSGED